jgi:hypothetical protein
MPRFRDADVVVIRELVGGAAVAVVAGFLAVVLFPSGELAGRVLVMAVACGTVAAWVSQWRVRLAVVVLTGLIFAGVLGDGGARSLGAPGPWSCVPVIGFAGLLGYGYRRLRRAATREPPEDQDDPAWLRHCR